MQGGCDRECKGIWEGDAKGFEGDANEASKVNDDLFCIPLKLLPRFPLKLPLHPPQTPSHPPLHPLLTHSYPLRKPLQTFTPPSQDLRKIFHLNQLHGMIFASFKVTDHFFETLSVGSVPGTDHS